MKTRIPLLIAVVLLTPVVFGQPVPAYTFADLPAGWAWDSGKIQGALLPAVYAPARPTNDPNNWLVPCGTYLRGGLTSDWVKEVKIVSVVGVEPTSISVFLDQDPVTKKSKTWRIEGWSIPGPWYITVDAVSQPGKNGTSKSTRYTVVGAGYVPDSSVPFLY